MGKIYEGENKLNILQVCDKLRNEITPAQAKVLASRYDAEVHPNVKAQFAHMVLDAYKHLPNTTEHDMMVRKLAKHLMEKYMKSNSAMEGESSAFKLLIDEIIKKGQESKE